VTAQAVAAPAPEAATVARAVTGVPTLAERLPGKTADAKEGEAVGAWPTVVNATLLEVPGLETVTVAVPCVAMSLAAIAAVSCPLLT
jgi:hypothetical protein